MKRIVICADGTWNRPEKDLNKDTSTNVVRLARAIKPGGHAGVKQQVFYDWSFGSKFLMPMTTNILLPSQSMAFVITMFQNKIAVFIGTRT